MTTTGPASVEVRRLDEGIRLLREEMQGFRSEMRSALDVRPTQSDLGALKLYTERELYHMALRMSSLEDKAKEDSRHKRQLTISLVTVALGALVSLAVSFLG